MKIKKKYPNLLVTAGAILGLLASGPAAWSKPKFSHAGTTIITNVTVIDGLGNEPMAGRDLLIKDGKIAAIGTSGSTKVPLPKGALEIDGKGLTVMPGLMDLHVHLQGGWANGQIPGNRYKIRLDDKSVQQSLSGYLYAGVTTVLDMGGDHKWLLKKRAQIKSGKLFGPRFFTTGAPWSQAPSSWDAGNTGAGDFGLSVKVSKFSDIPRELDRYKKDGIEIIKLYAGISQTVMPVLIAEAHKRNMLTVADLWSLNMNRWISQTTGLDGYAHSAGFGPVSQADQKWMAANKRFVIGNAVLGEKLGGLRVKEENGQKLMLKEPLIVDIFGKAEVEHFYQVYPKIRQAYYEGPESFYQQNNFGDLSTFRKTIMDNIKGSYDAGMLVACGTDDGYASVWVGEAMHREMELMVMAGIPELQVIKACTYNSAKVLRREKQFGSIQVGKIADLLVVQGNPAKNISDSRNVKHVFLRGKVVDRNSLKLK
jgi:imidazolonepropionase-like amidohydrolase